MSTPESGFTAPIGATTLAVVPQKGSFTPRENEKIRETVERLVARFGSQRVVAEKLGVLQPSLSNFIHGKSGMGIKTASKLAALDGMTLDSLLGVDPDTARPADKYPNRGIAIEFARRAGVSDSAINRLRRVRLVALTDAPPVWWMKRLFRYEDDARDPVEVIEV